MEQLPAWEFGEETNRFKYFATLIGHPDNRIHQLALRELDQADYSVLRTLDIPVDTDRLLDRIHEPNDADVKAIRILLMGLSGDQQLRSRLESGVQVGVGIESPYLGAYATALIELVGPDAITFLAATYLTEPGISLFAKELLIEAIAIQAATPDAKLQSSIFRAFNSMLWLEPRLTGAAARQFGARGNWSLQPALQVLLAEGSILDASNKKDVSQYIAFAEEVAANP
jgi:hypothetical protein